LPSPIGHLITGYTVYALARPQPVKEHRTVLICTLLSAVAADLDFLPGILHGEVARFHQGGSHSLGAVFFYAAGIWSVLRCCRIAQANYLALLFGSAYASHLLLDFFGADSGPPVGIPLFWPLMPGHYTSPMVVFMEIHRHERGMASFLMSGFTQHNLLAAAWEITLLAPLAWWAHRAGKVARRRYSGSADVPLRPAFGSVESSKETDI
jgi:inner membrane protein